MGRLALSIVALLAISAGFASGPAAARQGELCGGIAGRPCGAGEFCAYLPGLCPRVVKDASGVCKPVVEACAPGGPAVCGCDGRTYPNACEAERSGAFVRHEKTCG